MQTSVGSSSSVERNKRNFRNNSKICQSDWTSGFVLGQQLKDWTTEQSQDIGDCSKSRIRQHKIGERPSRRLQVFQPFMWIRRRIVEFVQWPFARASPRRCLESLLRSLLISYQRWIQRQHSRWAPSLAGSSCWSGRSSIEGARPIPSPSMVEGGREEERPKDSSSSHQRKLPRRHIQMHGTFLQLLHIKRSFIRSPLRASWKGWDWTRTQRLFVLRRSVWRPEDAHQAHQNCPRARRLSVQLLLLSKYR